MQHIKADKTYDSVIKKKKNQRYAEMAYAVQ